LLLLAHVNKIDAISQPSTVSADIVAEQGEHVLGLIDERCLDSTAKSAHCNANNDHGTVAFTVSLHAKIAKPTASNIDSASDIELV